MNKNKYTVDKFKNKPINVLFSTAENFLHKEVKTFDNFADMMRYMERDYSEWVINFDEGECCGQHYDIEIIRYDDYLE